jgi:hypothetical protein
MRVAPHLSPDQLADALAAARAFGNESFLAEGLDSVTLLLSLEHRADALTAAKAIGEKGYSVTEPNLIAHYLSVPQTNSQITELVAVARKYFDRCSTWALQALTNLFMKQQIKNVADALAVAKAIGREDCRARALISLVPHLSAKQKTETIADALAATERIPQSEYRVAALVSLAPYLGSSANRVSAVRFNEGDFVK